ncbi:MAG: hypothetical protein CVU97_01970 [Firmicutes bacterium HGW-Firmicutes-21]|nr:MAG: hypothetical protein CVU97_01970 [Firmicutes bacterium HGW-Firmicutes-21]
MNKIYFTKVFKGYSPDEVEAFIIKLNTELQQKQQDFATETRKLSGEIIEIKQRFEETIAINERLTEEVQRLNAERQNFIEQQKPSVEKITAPVEPIIRTEENGDYKKLCERMGERLLVADVRAEEIVKTAQREAKDILAKATDEAGEEINRLVEEASKRAESVYKAIDEYEKKQVFINAGLEQARKHIYEAIAEVEALITIKR